MNVRAASLFFGAVFFTTSWSSAAVLVDQQQLVIDTTIGGLAIGGQSAQKLAQVVTAGASGVLAGIRLPVACSSGDLTIEVLGVTGGVPNATVLSTQVFPGATLPAGEITFKSLVFSHPVPVSSGSQLAIVLSSSGNCGVFQGPHGDSYPGGNGFFQALPNSGGWVCFCDFNGPLDLPFQTLLNPANRPDLDFDGDGEADIAVYRQVSGEWFVLRSSDKTLYRQSWGCPSCGDLPLPADYDGDGRADIAVYRDTTGEWFILRSSNLSLLHVSWGAPSLGDKPVPRDYDRDGKADIAVYRQTSGQWFVRRSSDNTLLQLTWGAPSLGDVPIP